LYDVVLILWDKFVKEFVYRRKNFK